MTGKYANVFDISFPTIALTSVPYRGSLEQQQVLGKVINQVEETK